MKKTLQIILFCIFCICNINANTYTIKRLGIENGLSSNYVVGITQDIQGRMWFATESGLNCFDGNHFKVYKKYSSDLCGNELNAIYSDDKDYRIWIGSQRDGLSIFDCLQQTFRTVRAGENDQSITTNDITDIKGSKKGHGIWITTYHRGINYYDKKKDKFIQIYDNKVPALGGKKCFTGCDDGKGNIYLGHDGQGMSIISTKDWKLRNFTHSNNDDCSIPSNVIHSICVDSYNNVWVGTDNGLALFNPKTGKFTSFRHDPKNPCSILSGQIRDIKEMKNGELWICINMGGVSIIDLKNSFLVSPKELKFKNIIAQNNVNGLSSPNARTIFQDRFGNIWIGNYRAGIDIISYEQPSFRTLPYIIKADADAISRQVWGLSSIGNDVYVSAEEEIHKFANGKRKETINLAPYSFISNSHLNVIYRDKKNNLWLGGYMNGVMLFNPKTNKVERIKGSNGLNVNCFFEDGEDILIGADEGIYKYNNGNFVCWQEIQNQLPDRMVHGILRDKEGKLWIGTFGQGISIFNKNNKMSLNLVKSNGFPSNAVNHMILDSNKKVWVATREGLVKFDNTSLPKKYKVFKEEDGLENSQVRAICEDRRHNIWVSTNSGISLFDMNSKILLSYNNHDGIPIGEFMSKSVSMTNDGLIYFGSQNGVCYFNPDYVTRKMKVAPASITGFATFTSNKESKNEEKEIAFLSGKVELPNNQNTFKISFSVLDITQSDQAEFSYMLEGLENIWYNAQNEKQITFRNIPPGKYKFLIRSRLKNQDWDSNVASLDIIIAPPLLLTWYFKVLYCIIATIIIILILKSYKKKVYLEGSLKMEKKKISDQQELNNERLRFYTNITHELRTPLTLILGPLEDLLCDKSLSLKQINKIGIIRDSSHRLLNLINDIMEFRKTETQNRKLSVEKDDISTVINEVGIRFKELNSNPKVSYIIDIKSENNNIYFDKEMIVTILNNLLSNASKYTPKGEIRISLNSINENNIDYTVISVSDTGYGITENDLPHIFNRYYQGTGKYQIAGSGIGLALVKGLVELHQAILDVESQEGKGTTFTLKLITDNTYPEAIHKNSVEVQPNDFELSEEETQEVQNAQKTLVLIVEDNSDIREYIRTSLCDDYEILTASNGKEGWDIAKNKIPNIIISDIMMPVMDGIELCKLVKEDICTSHIPVILLTAKDSLQDKEMGYDSGADSYITKPFSAKLLTSRIVNILEARKKIARLIKSTQAQSEQEEAYKSLNKLDNVFIDKITKIIEDNLDMEKMDIGFIADKMCMSHSTLYRKIKGLTDMSANELIRKIKMQNGEKLLLKGEQSISEISYMIGFSSVAYFRQCFKDEYGMSPSEYVKSKSSKKDQE